MRDLAAEKRAIEREIAKQPKAKDMNQNAKDRISQAIETIHDESVFSPDQIVLLNNAFVLIGWAISENTPEKERSGE